MSTNLSFDEAARVICLGTGTLQRGIEMARGNSITAPSSVNVFN